MTALPPDPVEYDSPRAQIARAKGLDQPYIAGGRDPDPEPGLEEDRHYGKLLLAMVVGAHVRRLHHRHRADHRDRQRAPVTPIAAPSSAIEGPAWAFAVDALIDDLRDLIRIPSVTPPSPDLPDGELLRRPPHRGGPRRARPRTRGHRTRTRSRLGPRPPPRRRHRRRAVPPAVAPRRRPGPARPLDARAVRRRHRGRLHLRPRRGRHEGDGRDGARRRPAARRRGARRRSRPRPRPDPRAPPRRPLHLHGRRGGGRPRRREMGRREPAGVAASGRRRQRVRRRVDDGRADAGSTRSRSPRRASPRTASPSAGRGATARCPARTTPRSSPRPSSSAWPSPARPGSRRSWRASSSRPRPHSPTRPARSSTRWPATIRAVRRPPSSAACDPMYARALRALLRDTLSPDVVHAGIKYNVIPGDAVVEVDCRVLPGTTEPDMRAIILERLGPELAAACQVELIVFGAPVEAPAEGELFDLLAATIRDHDPDGIPLPVMAPVRHRRQAHRVRRHADVRLLTAAARPRGALPRAVPRHRRARLDRRAALGPAGPLRRGPPLLLLTAIARRDQERGSSRVVRAARPGPPRRTSCRRRSSRPTPSPSPDRGRPRRGATRGSSWPHVPSEWRCWMRSASSAVRPKSMAILLCAPKCTDATRASSG